MTKLDEADRTLWIRTILAMHGTEPQRRAFVDGFNGANMPRRTSPHMRRCYDLGAVVCQRLRPAPTKPRTPPSPAAQKAGGLARAASLSPERRAEIARNAANARWRKG